MKTFLTMPWPGLHPLHLPSRYTFIKLRFSGLSLLVLAPPREPTPVCPPHLPGHLEPVSGGRQAKAATDRISRRTEA